MKTGKTPQATRPARKTILVAAVIATTLCAGNVGLSAQSYAGPVGIGLPSGRTAEAPLHVYKDGYDTIRVVSMNEGKSISTFPNVSVNQSVFFRRENSGGYPSDISVVYGYGYGLPSRRAGCINWYEQSGYSNTHRWGGGSDVNMTLSGNSLGIGVTPSANLHVRGGVLHPSNPAGTTLFTTGANVGTSSGVELFERSLYLRRTSNGSGWANVRLHDGIAPQSGTATPASTTRVWWERSPQDTLQSWGDKATAYMTLKGDKLGIGTTNPTEKLEVNGKIKATGLQVATGNVGIGTSNPEAVPFHVLNSESLPSAAGSYKRLVTFRGRAASQESNEVGQSVWIVRDRDSSVVNWETVRIHDAVGIRGSYNEPRTNTKCWWERDPKREIQAWGNYSSTYMVINKGNVGIGTTSPTQKLEVNGTIRAKKVVVEPPGWSDFVFSPNYQLRPLEEVEAHIQEKGHLPEIPSETEALENGVELAEMNAKLLQKVEELTLYIIEQNKQIIKQNERMIEQDERISVLEEQSQNK